MRVGILCGGRGTRIASIAGDLPKALVPVAGRPFIDHQLSWLRSSGVNEVVLLTGYREAMLRDHVGDGSRFGLRVTYSGDGDAPRGTAGAIARARPLLGDPFLCVYGDALLQAPPPAVGAALRDGDDGVMSIFRNDDRWVRSNVSVDGDRVSAYRKDAPPGTMHFVDYGINAFRARAFDEVRGDEAADLATVHGRMISGGTLRAYEVAERFYEIGTPDGLHETEAFIRMNLRAGGPS